MNEDWLDRLLRETSLRTLFVAGAALLVVLGLAGLLYGVKPSWQALDAIRGQRDLTAAGTPAGGELSTSIEALRQQVQARRDDFEGESTTIPRVEIESYIVGSLDRLSAAHDVELRSVQPDEASRLWMFEELPYTVEVRGAYRSLHRWMHQVERELRPMVIKQFTIVPEAGDDDVTVRIRIVAYRPGQETTS